MQELIDPETGEVVQLRHRGVNLEIVQDPRLVAYRRHELLGAARSILNQFRDAAGEPRYRTSHCNFTPTGRRVEVYIAVGKSGSTYASFSTQHCGSVWLCPVCASRIASARAERIQRQIDVHKMVGGTVSFLTVTMPHRAGNRLVDELALWDGALRKFSSGRAAQTFRDKHRQKGFIRALEIVHGTNGWHVHAHLLLFLDDAPDYAQLRADAYQFWLKCCPKDRRPSFKRGVNLTPADEFVSTYMSKWGVCDELARSHTKTGRTKTSRTPFELLADASEGDQKARNLFSEYADCFVKPGEKRARSRKQIFTSRTLENVAEASEDEDAKRILDDAQANCIGSIDVEHFEVIRRNNFVAPALDIAKREGIEGLIELVRTLEAGENKDR